MCTLCVYVCVCMCVYMYIHVCMYVCMCVCMCVRAHVLGEKIETMTCICYVLDKQKALLYYYYVDNIFRCRATKD